LLDDGDEGGTTTHMGGDESTSADEGDTGEPSDGCGDGAVDEGESCDDGNDDNGDGCSNDCFASGEVVWETTVEDPDARYDWGSDLVVTPDGDVLVVGTWGFGWQNSDVFVGRFAQGGTKRWTTTYDHGGELDDAGYSLALGEGDRLYVVGDVYEDGEGQNAWLAGMDAASGEFEWSDTVDGVNHGVDGGASVVMADDGNPIFSGRQHAAEGFDAFLRKTDENGQTIWHENVDLAYDDWVSDSVLGASGTLWLAGAAQQQQSAGMSFAQTNSEGLLLHAGEFPHAGWLSSVTNHLGGGFAVGGLVQSGEYPDFDEAAWFARLNGDGEIAWEQTLSGEWEGGYDSVQDVLFAHAGHLYVTYRLQHAAEFLDTYLVKLDAQGATIWEQPLGPEVRLNRLAVDAQDNLYVTGQAYEDEQDDWNLYVAKIAP
jgi:cysteine-rich repeat protein